MLFQFDDITYEARTEPDLRFLRTYGRVFRIWDQLVSGNLCFGVEGPYGRLFIKYAGAKTVNYPGRTEDAVRILKNAIPVLETQHPAMPRLLSHGQLPYGYAAVMEYLDAQPLWDMDTGDRKTLERLQSLPMTEQLSLYDRVLSLHLTLCEKGYIACDFSARNVLLDTRTANIYVCDTDEYLACPSRNTRGRMPGEITYLSPEELLTGSTLAEDTTVFKMGRLAQTFFCRGDILSKACFAAPAPLYPIIQKALSPDRAKRYPTVSAYANAWRNTVKGIWLR